MSSTTCSVNKSSSSGDGECEEEEETCQRREEDPEEGGSGAVEQLVGPSKKNAFKTTFSEDYRSLKGNVSHGDVKEQRRFLKVGEGSHLEQGPPHRPNPGPATQTRPKTLLTGAPSKHSHHSSTSSLRGTDLFWEEVKTQSQSQTHTPSRALSEPDEEDDEEEAGSAASEVRTQTVTGVSFAERRVSRREKKMNKSVRRRQRRREKLRQSQQQQENTTQEDEALSTKNKERYICAVCLDVYLSPHMCRPCNHIFCEPCLRTLAKNSPSSTPCPLCRTIITHVFFQKELNQRVRTLFPAAYLTRKQNFQKAICAKWPLPSCRKLFRIFGAGFQRHSSPIARHQFPPSGGYRLNSIDFVDDSRGWRFDMDPVIIYIYSVNWVIGFLIFCFLCYIFFPLF
ncbi:E3 ubiquitin-protein ligase RNF180 [Gouania willdenowi]|uniref:E3 ubiquitin-protein ligase RNF180 n=1 Tax=Gouania willdenowi TaxID=441366 RepID=UPI0010550ACC|nr:E3 ubiquitin-protein ligase RNF180 [Gouania willdenowi]